MSHDESSDVRLPSADLPKGGIYGLGDDPEAAEVVLLGLPWEATTSYRRGTARGPRAIVEASAQVELFDYELGQPADAGIAMLPSDAEIERIAAEADSAAQRVIAAFDAGRAPQADDPDLACVNRHSAWLNERVEREVTRWLDAGKLVGVVGGDHSVAFGSVAAQAARHPGIGVLQIDAHADLRVAYQGFTDSHASVMQRVLSLPGVAKVVGVGIRDICAEEHAAIVGSQGRVVAFFDADIARDLQEGSSMAAIFRQVADQLPQSVYVSFDIDGLDPALCPNTGTPVPGGLSFNAAVCLLAEVVRSGRRIVGFDLCEVAPGADDWDANVGARVLYKLIGYALASRAE